jgi:dTDP-4-amino-4,6-dideoxygalactose transaminase
MRLIRNHAEAVVGDKQEPNINNMIGYNFRLGEIESAIAIEQLKKLNSIVASRQALAERLNEGLSKLKGLNIPVVEESGTHVYYIYGMTLDFEELKCSRENIVRALAAEGVEVSDRYQNLHLLPMYQKKIAYGTKGFPWNSGFVHRNVSYQKGICPVAEELNDSSYIGFGLCVYELSDADIDLVIKAFTKVWANLESLT